MTGLTFKQAKKITIDIWDYVCKYGNKPPSKKLYKIVKKHAVKYDGLYHKEKFVALHNACGFCQHYEMICRECPLWWEDAVPEYDSDFQFGLPACSRNFWHWAYWVTYGDMEKAKEWAEKVYQEVLNVEE